MIRVNSYDRIVDGNEEHVHSYYRLQHKNDSILSCILALIILFICFIICSPVIVMGITGTSMLLRYIVKR